jgi:hypothetical protein
MIRQGPSWRFRNKETYYIQERRSDMTLNLTELKDEPLGMHQKHAATCLGVCGVCFSYTAGRGAEQVDVADDERSFTFDVDGLSDEALDPRRHVSALSACMPPPAGGCQACFVSSEHDGDPRVDAAMRNPI